jgi:hypothetical protein
MVNRRERMVLSLWRWLTEERIRVSGWRLRSRRFSGIADGFRGCAHDLLFVA